MRHTVTSLYRAHSLNSYFFPEITPLFESPKFCQLHFQVPANKPE